MAVPFVRHELAVFSLPIASCEVCGRFFATNTLFDSNTPSPPFFFEKRFCSRGPGEANQGGKAEARCLRRRRGPVMTHSLLRTARMLRNQPGPIPLRPAAGIRLGKIATKRL